MHYAYLKTVLQALTFLRGPRTWVLKSPQHAEQLPALTATFPDATIAFTHRDPVAVIQSAITMMAYADRLRRTDRPGMAGRLLERPGAQVARRVRARPRPGAPDRGVTSASTNLNGNEITVLESLYDKGWRRVDARFAALRALSRRQPRGSTATSATTCRATSASPRGPRSRFGFYFDRFDVRPEVHGGSART